MSKLPTGVKIVAVNLLVLLIGVVIVELIFGTWFQSAHALYQFTKPRNVTLTQKNLLPGPPDTIRYTRDRYGFRGLDVPMNKIDIITVGGSTTDQRYLDDDMTYQSVIKSRFAAEGKAVAIVNAGIDGQSTIGHLQNFPSWFDRVDGLRARYILYYVGINDLLRIAATDAYDTVAADSRRLQVQLLIREKSVFYQLYRLAKQYVQPHPLLHDPTRKNIAVGSRLVDAPGLPDYRTPAFLASLERLKGRIRELDALTRKMGARSVFVTQRSARWVRKDGKIWGIERYHTGDEHEFVDFGEVNGVDIYNIENAVASAIMDACTSVNAICLNLLQEIDFDLARDFYDPVHTTAAGSRVIGEYLHLRMRDRIDLR